MTDTPAALAGGVPRGGALDRHWFFTWRTYGTWLPGEDGFVGWYRARDGRRVTDNQFGQPTTEPIPALKQYAEAVMTHEPVLLTHPQGTAVLDELLRTCRFRNWKPDAIAVIPNHVHIVFGGTGDLEPSDLLAELKSYCSRVLNRPARRPKGWWWADGGSKRPIREHADRLAAIQYVRDQSGAIAVWLSEDARSLIG